MKKGAIILIILSINILSIADDIEKFQHHRLFEIERSRNQDVVAYMVNTKLDGSFNKKSPLNVHWLKRADRNQIVNLTQIQRKYGYGVKISKVNEKEIHFKIAAIPEQKFIVKKNIQNKLIALTKIENQEVIVNSIYIDFVKDTKWVPQISYIKLMGTSLSNNKIIEKKIKP